MSDIKNGQLETGATSTKNSATVACCVEIRDWFAGMSLQGILACPEPMVDWGADISAENAYKQADAMLKARNQ